MVVTGYKISKKKIDLLLDYLFSSLVMNVSIDNKKIYIGAGWIPQW